MRLQVCVLALILGASLTPAPVAAQIRASELATVSQTIDGTKITVTYSRPRLRGRAAIFGTKAAHWGETWTPGANYATTLEVSKDITLNKQPVPRGKYSVWMVLRQNGNWTTVLDPNWQIYHMDPPDSNATQIRIASRAEAAPVTEVLTWSLPALTASGGVLEMRWSTVRVALSVAVQPSLEPTMAEADAAPYVGTYEYTERMGADSGRVSTFVLTYQNKTLKGRWQPNDGYMNTFAMIRVSADEFVPGLYDKSGAIYEVIRPEMVFTFQRVGGKPTTFEVRDELDRLDATAKRKP
jgi:hypothetical protein